MPSDTSPIAPRRRSKNAIVLRRLVASLKAGAIGVQPIAARRAAAARLLGISVATFDRMREAGQIPKPLRLFGGSMIVWPTDELKEWVAAGCPPDAEWQTIKRAAANGRR